MLRELHCLQEPGCARKEVPHSQERRSWRQALAYCVLRHPQTKGVKGINYITSANNGIGPFLVLGPIRGG